MVTFNKKAATIGQCLNPIANITTKEEATQFFNDYVDWLKEGNKSLKQKRPVSNEQIAKINIGYYAGYFDKTTYTRILTLFDLEHPYFGKEYPSPEYALGLGLKIGEEIKNKNQ